VFFCALCTTCQFGANLVSRQCKWSELSTSFQRGFLSDHSRMSVPVPGSVSRTMALFINIAGRKKGISPHLTLQHGPQPIFPHTFVERSLEGDVSTSSLRHPVGAGSSGGTVVTNFLVQDDGVRGSANRERAHWQEICRAEWKEVDDWFLSSTHHDKKEHKLCTVHNWYQKS
jgi:hypothetical protein